MFSHINKIYFQITETDLLQTTSKESHFFILNQNSRFNVHVIFSSRLLIKSRSRKIFSIRALCWISSLDI